MKVMRSEVEKLFVGLGTAADVVKDWSVKRLSSKVANLPKSHPNGKTEDPDSNSLLKKITKALGNGKDVTVVKDDAEGEAPAEADAPAPAKKDKKDKKTKQKDKAGKPEQADNTDKKKKKVGRPSADGKPGKIETIVTLLKKASKSSPITKEEILDELVKVFGKEDREKMKKTISLQVPTFLRNKGHDIHKNDEGYWIKK